MKLLLVMSLMFCSVSFAGNRESGGRTSATAVYVDFKSNGAGIDTESRNTYEVLLNAARSRGEVVDATVELRGREGEIRYCVQLSNATQRYYYILSLANSITADTQLNGAQRTSVYVGMNCHSFESSTEQSL